MRALSIPQYDSMTVYCTCLDSMKKPNLAINILNSIKPDIDCYTKSYNSEASNQKLYRVYYNSPSPARDILLTSLYTKQMVIKGKPARTIYDDLLSKAPLGRCPYCGLGHVSTLDHYLPKMSFPIFSVHPPNLVPACKDCNTGKSSAIALKAEDQCLHPYFDHGHFVNDQWLYAKVNQNTPASVLFYVRPPDSWDSVSKGRVHSHFALYKLDSRYSLEAANELASLRLILSTLYETSGVAGVKFILKTNADAYEKQNINSWQTALYQALAASDWYCDKGFN